MSHSRKFGLGILCIALLSLLLAACSIRDEASIPKGPTVDMTPTHFATDTVTVPKGQVLTLDNTSGVQHIIANGTWDGATAKPGKEAGAPTVNLNFPGNGSQRVGPFDTAGTFNLYCTIHQDMNLTITVK